MYYTKESVNRFTYKMYRFLEDEHIILFKRMKRHSGTVLKEQYPTIIELDHRDQVIPTLVHEVLHYLHPEKSEEWVLEMESKIINRLSQQQVKNIIKRLAEVI